jgi:hypothetical protein
VFSELIDHNNIHYTDLIDLSNVHHFHIAKYCDDGFITNYKLKQYVDIYKKEMALLKSKIMAFKNHTFVIMKLAPEDNECYKKIIKPNITRDLFNMENVRFCK